jgi:glutamyl-tRNA synthetase
MSGSPLSPALSRSAFVAAPSARDGRPAHACGAPHAANRTASRHFQTYDRTDSRSSTIVEQTNKVRVRFAPSPTGRLHIGGARTAIFNWAFARANGGDFILRIEDTDPERSTEENVRVIVDAMKWLHLDWDEGPEVGGPAGPYFQMQRMDTYRAALEELKAKGAVYPCFCTKEELDAKRAAAEKSGEGYAGYDRTCRDLDPDEVKRRMDAGEPYVWRLKVPLDHGPIEFDDAVYGPMSFPADVMDDMILVRSDGSPTYNFAVVCDDSNMGITHVIRGDDHLSNTPRQILIYEALGRPVPQFAHLSMILGPDGHKLSKRHGATSVEEYRDRGYLPDAMVNFLALLGWSLDGETTLIPREQLCSEFSLDRITKKDAVFDETKLDWMNGQYIQRMGAAAWVAEAKPWLVEAAALGMCVPAGVNEVPTPNPSDPNAPAPEPIVVTDEARERARSFVESDPAWFEKLYPLVAERLTRLDQIPEKLAYLFWGKNVRLDAKSVKKVLRKESARPEEALRCVREILAEPENEWEFDGLQQKCRAAGEERGFKPKNLFQPVRVAVCGNMVSPPLFESIELLPREDVLARIDGVLDAVYGA